MEDPLLLLVVAAGFGSIVDTATLEGGLFMSSAVLMALATPAVNRLLAPREGYEVTDQPTVSSMGVQWFAIRCLLLLTVHHLWMFGLEAGRWDLFPRAIGKALTSSTLSTSSNTVHITHSTNAGTAARRGIFRHIWLEPNVDRAATRAAEHRRGRVEQLAGSPACRFRWSAGRHRSGALCA